MSGAAPLAGLRVGVFGLGEAGSEVAGGLAGAGAQVIGYDPAPVREPAGVDRVPTPVAAAADADLVVAVTASADSPLALAQAFDVLAPGVVYADLATSAPARKRALAQRCGDRVAFVDVALMSDAPGRGLMIPSLACGPGAARYVELLSPAGAPIEIVDGPAGSAATRKLVRSVAIKGIAGVVIESLAAARAAGIETETWDMLTDAFASMDAAFLHRLVDGTPRHAERRFHEMQAARALLIELGVDPSLTDGTVAQLDRMRHNG